MAKKYVRYESIIDGEDTQQFESYRDAFTHYMQGDAPKTLWGVSEDDDYSVIFSKS